MQHRPAPAAKSQHGVAIIMMLTVLTLAATTYIVTSTPNLLTVKRAKSNATVLDQSLQALTGYALIQPIPGGLPCPDTTGDGLENLAGLTCSSQLGLLPVRSLGLDRLTDATGAPLWYAVSLEYIANAATPKNSSLISTLTLDGRSVAAVVIAPGQAINNQSRSPLSVADYLEGVNADADLNEYDSTIAETQNDQLLALETDSLWAMVESRATEAADILLSDYRTNCGEYPWAGTFGGPYTSVVSQQAGAIPVTTALPWDWNTVCPFGTAPAPSAWLTNHWANQLFYRMCTVAEGNCVTLANHPDSPAAGAIVGPGQALAGQNRPSVAISDYYEDENSNGSSVDFKFLSPFNYSTTFNDTAKPLTP